MSTPSTSTNRDSTPTDDGGTRVVVTARVESVFGHLNGLAHVWISSNRSPGHRVRLPIELASDLIVALSS